MFPNVPNASQCFPKLHNVSKCCWILHNMAQFPQCFPISSKVAQCFQMLQNISKSFPMISNYSKCFPMLLMFPMLPRVSHVFQTCTIFPNDVEYFPIFPNVPQCSPVLHRNIFSLHKSMFRLSQKPHLTETECVYIGAILGENPIFCTKTSLPFFDWAKLMHWCVFCIFFDRWFITPCRANNSLSTKTSFLYYGTTPNCQRIKGPNDFDLNTDSMGFFLGWFSIVKAASNLKMLCLVL